MNLSDLNNLDLKTVADWPMPAKFGLLGVLFVVIVLAGWWFDWRATWRPWVPSRPRNSSCARLS